MWENENEIDGSGQPEHSSSWIPEGSPPILSTPPPPPPPDERADGEEIASSTRGVGGPSLAGVEADDDEKKRIRRQRLEEWKRARATGSTANPER